MKMTRLVLASALAACMALPLFAAPSTSCPAMRDSAKCDQKKGGPEHKKWQELGLSADQKEKLKALRQEMQGLAKEHRESVKAIRDKMKTEFLKPTVDRNALSALVAEQVKANQAFAEKRIDHLLKVKAVLTKAQFEKVVSHEFWGDKGPMMGRGMGPEKGRRNEDKN